MDLILDCGVVVIPNCAIGENGDLVKDKATQKEQFERFNYFCKLNNFKPTPESMKAFLEFEKGE